jgi:hypothetical protein
MTENGGSIVNVTSDAGATGYPGWGAYGLLNCKELEYVSIMLILEI